ncbi:MAG: hypothetical protein AMXMBFR44_0110 [Candidatus Campbellbacteria bacterium]
MAKEEKPPLPEGQDPVYAAICLHWPRNVLPFVGVSKTVEHELIASGHLSAAGRLHEACEHIQHAAFHGEPPPYGDVEIVRTILEQYRPATA